jgi:hypothetical protein
MPQPFEDVSSTKPDEVIAPPAGPFVRHAGWLCIAAGVLFLVAQIVMWTFDQRLNLETSQDPVFTAAKIVLLAGLIVLMFALIAVYGLQAQSAGRLGVAAFGLAIVGTMMLAGDLWFESFAVPWLWAHSPVTPSSPPDGHCLGSRASGPASFLSRSRSPSSLEGSPDIGRYWRPGGFRWA